MPLKFCHSIEEAKTVMRCPQGLSSTCIADRCMAWRFVRTHVPDGEGGTKECGESHGFCGLAVDPRIK